MIFKPDSGGIKDLARKELGAFKVMGKATKPCEQEEGDVKNRGQQAVGPAGTAGHGGALLAGVASL